MKYTVTFEVTEGDCELYKNFDKHDADSACKTCPLNGAYYCMDLNMHKAKVVSAKIEEDKK